MGTETTQLRRRMHVCGKPTSDEEPSSPSEDIFVPAPHDSKGNGNGNPDPGSPLTVEYQSDSDTSENGSERAKGNGPTLTTSPLSQTPSRRNSNPYPQAPPSTRTSWYEFDLSVVVALVSPIGNWLTGGDHVKNILLLLLLIFYLHQIIEIPWALYNLSRPRRPARPKDSEEFTSEDLYQAAASSELRSLEFFFLILTVLSPLLGAFILRYVAATILGTDIVSWFSTSLFVLATGIRPWRHVVERFQQRITDLHDVIHYPPLSVSATEDVQAKLDDMTVRMAELEQVMSKVKGKMADVTEEVYDYVDDAMDGVEKATRRHEKKCDASRASQELHLAALEASVESIKKGKLSGPHLSSSSPSGRGHTYMSSAPGFTDWLFSYLPYTSSTAVSCPTSPKSPSSTLRASKSASSSKHRHFPSPPRLETIPEDVDFAFLQPHRHHSRSSPPASPISSSLPASPQRSPPLLRIPGVNLALRCGDLATLPLRTVVQYLLSARVGSSTLSPTLSGS